MLKKIFLILIGIGLFSLGISTNAAPAPLFYNLNTGAGTNASAGSMWGGYTEEEDSSPAAVVKHVSETEKMVALGLMGAAVLGGIAAIKIHHKGGDDNGAITVKCWGHNVQGQLGDGTYENPRVFPVDVVGTGGSGRLSGVSQITGGDDHTCALLGDKVKCWGINTFGQLGNGEFGLDKEKNSPVDVIGPGGAGILFGVTQITAGNEHTCALLKFNDGSVKCWGDNYHGQLGNGESGLDKEKSSPVDVVGIQFTSFDTLTGVTQIAAGGNHTCALLKENGEVVCWGYNNYGQLGDDSATSSSIPVYVKPVGGGTGVLGGVKKIAAGNNHTCALLINDGRVVCWGDNQFGQLGDNSKIPRDHPDDVVTSETDSTPLSGVVQITAGDNHTCALLDNGQVKCWGRNDHGQLGDYSKLLDETRTYPVDVVGTNDIGLLTEVAQISAGGDHTCARLNNGGLKCWGFNNEGQLGDGSYGSFTNKHYPVDVLGLGGVGTLSGVIQTFIGDHGNHTCALVRG